MDTEERPSKRLKTDTAIDEATLNPDEASSFEANQSVKHTNHPKKSIKGERNVGNNATRAQNTNKGIFSQPSVICAADKGIFVTSDKGREKKCLLELSELVLEHFADIEQDTDSIGQHKDSTKKLEENMSGQNTAERKPQAQIGGIEADIESELAELQGQNANHSTSSARLFQLITLDIPCVSFLRFRPGLSVDPVNVVHQICLTAADPKSAQRSRFIKRLTPVSSLGKALGQGLQRACDEVLPETFGPDPDGKIASTTFAIRPSIRNNDKLTRDQVIKYVADKVQEIGNNEHKVDLKNYSKGIIVEVYRGWVGMCVVNNAKTGSRIDGYEDLKRYNLAEIYANR